MQKLVGRRRKQLIDKNKKAHETEAKVVARRQEMSAKRSHLIAYSRAQGTKDSFLSCTPSNRALRQLYCDGGERVHSHCYGYTSQ